MTTTPDTATAKKALGLARDTALTLAKGPAATGFVVTRKGVSVLRERRARSRAESVGVPEPRRLATAATKESRRRRLVPGRRVALVALLALAGAGVAAVLSSRRTEVPPPAAAPPGLGTPNTNGHHGAPARIDGGLV